jgi:hypothetical protein
MTLEKVKPEKEEESRTQRAQDILMLDSSVHSFYTNADLTGYWRRKRIAMFSKPAHD